MNAKCEMGNAKYRGRSLVSPPFVTTPAFRIPHFAFRIPHFAFRISHFAFRISHFAFRISHFAFRIS